MRTVILKYQSLSENVRLVLTASIGAFLGLIIYELIYQINPMTHRATSSWLLAFVLGVARQHGLHRWLTFQSKSPYWSSLFRAYLMYSGSLVLGLILNIVLIDVFNINHRIAWLSCLILTAFISLFFLKKFVFKKELKR